jgi:hypothetical protein
LALYFFQILFSCPPSCQPGWPASPCTCNDLWLLSQMAVCILKENNCFFSSQIKLHPLIWIGVYPPSFDTSAGNGVLCGSRVNVEQHIRRSEEAWWKVLESRPLGTFYNSVMFFFFRKHCRHWQGRYIHRSR